MITAQARQTDIAPQAARVAGLAVPLVLAGAVLGIGIGLWTGLGMIHASVSTQWRVELEVMIPLVSLLLLVPVLYRAGFYWRPLAIPLGVVLIPTLGLFLLSRIPESAAILHVTPRQWLVGLQVFRLFGGVLWLVALASRSLGKPYFALEAGVLDVIVGAAALPTAWLVSTGSGVGIVVALAWNALGLFDFALAVALSRVPDGGPLFMLRGQNRALTALGPGVLAIVAFGVPIAIMLHALSLWQLFGKV